MFERWVTTMALATAFMSGAGCTTRDEGANMDATRSTEAADLLHLFHQQEPTFRREPVTLTLWQHGGGPGEGFTSDQLVLELRPDRSATATYTRTRFDASYAPPFLAEKFTAPVPRERAEDILRRTLGGVLFTRAHPAERDPSIGGVIKEEWDLSRGAARAHKMFFKEPPPADYAAERSALAGLMTELAQHGTREVLHKKQGAR
jgi:hypothetical protein